MNKETLSCLCPAETQTAPRPYSDGEIRSFRINGGGCDLARWLATLDAHGVRLGWTEGMESGPATTEKKE